jgi:hypothetical protein
VDSVLALVRENKELLWSSMVKETMKRKKPSFSESYHGYRTFSELLEDAEKEGIVRLQTDPRSGTYVVAGFGNEERKVTEKLKERKVQKPRWRSRPRRQKPAAPVETVSPEEAAAAEGSSSETEPTDLGEGGK